MTERNEIVKPTELAKELDVAPQLVFSWIRNEKLPAETCVCGHFYIMRDVADEFVAERARKQAEKEAKIQAELEASEESEAVSA